MAVVSDAFYLPTDDPAVFFATGFTQGPWEPGVQHAGPPSALLTRTIEALPTTITGTGQLARLTMEILGPIRTGEVSVRAEVSRPGRTVELAEAELSAGGRIALRCRAWRIRATPVPLPDGLGGPLPTAPPIPPEGTAFTSDRWRGGYLDSVEFRFTDGSFDDSGPADVWTRVRLPLIAGEEMTPTQRLMAVADSGNGLSGLLPFEDWWYINTDLSVHLHRLPAGEWIHLAAKSTLDPLGIGLAETELFDEEGRVGRGAQALMVGPRSIGG